MEEPQAALQSPPKAPAPPILTSLKADAEVSSQIKNALEAELEDLPVKGRWFGKGSLRFRQVFPEAGRMPGTSGYQKRINRFLVIRRRP